MASGLPPHLDAARAAYPSRDVETRKSREVWLQEKAESDQKRTGMPPNLWCVQGQFYDLSDFAKKHPGGAEWITLTKGMDITEFYFTHHLNQDKADALLKKYHVGSANPPCPNSAFTWDANGFYLTLKRRAWALLKSTGTGPTLTMKALTAAVLLAYVAVLAWVLWVGPSLLALLVAGVLMHTIQGLGHNFFHQANSPLRFVFDLTLFSSHEWRISHALSHHVYPNLDTDIEVYALEPFIFFMHNKPSNSPLALVYYNLLALLLPHFECLRRWGLVLAGRKAFRPEFLLPFVPLAALVCTWGGAGALFWAGHHSLAALLLIIVSTPVHRSTYAWTEGQTRPPPAADFGEHILLTTHDYHTDVPLPLSLLAFEMFNDHTTHHLFPTVDLSRMRTLRPVVLATIREFSIPYREFSFGDLLVQTYANLYQPQRTAAYKMRKAEGGEKKGK